MSVKIEKYSGQSFEELESVFIGSDIYEKYFRKNGMKGIFTRASSADELYVALSPEGKVAGVMWICMRGFCGLYPYLKLIGVHPDFQGCGAGGEMLRALENLGRESGAKKVSLMVSDFNTAARGFYRYNGYYELGAIPDASIEGVAEVVMLKDIV